MFTIQPAVNPSGSRARGAPVTQVSAPRGSSLCRRAAHSLSAPVRSTVSAAPAACPHRCLLQVVSRRNSSQTVPWLQKVSFCPPYSPIARSPPTGFRRRSGMGTFCRMRHPKPGASSSRSRWECRLNPHFRVRMGRPHTTPCQVNNNKSFKSPSSEFKTGVRAVIQCKERTTNWRVWDQGGTAKKGI